MKHQFFAPIEAKCWNCGEKYVPFSKDWFRLKIAEWLPEKVVDSHMNWSMDRVYQENLRYCSEECLYEAREKAEWAEIHRAIHKTTGKRR